MQDARESKAMERKKWKVFIVEDHALVRRGYSYLVDRESDLMIAGEAESGAEALDKIEKVQPDLVIIDISLPDCSGLDLIKSIRASDEDLPILVVSMYDEAVYAWRAFRYGAKGYVVKGKPDEAIMQAIRNLIGGGYYMSASMMNAVMDRVKEDDTGLENDTIDSLTDRELDIFNRLGLGMSAREISESLHISSKTVDSHRLRIRNKLGVSSSAALSRRAMQWMQDQDGKN